MRAWLRDHGLLIANLLLFGISSAAWCCRASGAENAKQLEQTEGRLSRWVTSC